MYSKCFRDHNVVCTYMYNPSKFVFFKQLGIIQTAWQIHTSEVDTMFNISMSSTTDPNKSKCIVTNYVLKIVPL